MRIELAVSLLLAGLLTVHAQGGGGGYGTGSSGDSYGTESGGDSYGNRGSAPSSYGPSRGNGPSYGPAPTSYSGGGNPGYPIPTFSSHELDKALEFGHRLASEKEFARKRTEYLKDAKTQSLKKLDDLIDIKVPNVLATQAEQDDRLTEIRMRIKDLLHSLGPEEAKLDGEVAATDLNENQLAADFVTIHNLQTSNHRQSGVIAKSITFLAEAKEKLYEKLAKYENDGEHRITEVVYNTRAAIDLINTRHCSTQTVHIEIEHDTAQGEVTSYIKPRDLYGDVIPTVVCVLQGFVTHLNLDQSQSYGAYPDELQNLAIAVDCEALDGYVLVKAFDLSRGTGNSFSTVYVEVKTCSLGPQSHAPA